MSWSHSTRVDQLRSLLLSLGVRERLLKNDLDVSANERTRGRGMLEESGRGLRRVERGVMREVGRVAAPSGPQGSEHALSTP